MDYEVLNQVIKQIIDIVNNYNKDKNYSYEQSEKLVLALFGYYLAMGEDIFTKINIILESLEIDYCPDFVSYRKAYERHDSILSIDLVIERLMKDMILFYLLT